MLGWGVGGKLKESCATSGRGGGPRILVPLSLYWAAPWPRPQLFHLNNGELVLMPSPWGVSFFVGRVGEQAWLIGFWDAVSSHSVPLQLPSAWCGDWSPGPMDRCRQEGEPLSWPEEPAPSFVPLPGPCRMRWEELPLRAPLSGCGQRGERDPALRLRVQRPEVLGLLPPLRASLAVAADQKAAAGGARQDQSGRRACHLPPCLGPAGG